MILFDVIMTFIEDFVLSYYSLKISHTPHKFCHILFMTLICMLETFMLTYATLNNFILLICLILTQYISIFLLKHKHNMYNFIIPILIITFLSFSNMVSLLISSFIVQDNPVYIMRYPDGFIFLCIISRIIYIGLCIVVDKYENQFDTVMFEKYNWLSFTIFSLSINIFLTIIYESIFYEKNIVHTLYLLIFISLIIIISLFYFYVKTKMNYRLYIEMSTQLLKEQYSKELYQKTKDLSYKILLDKHEMYYNLLHIQNCICNKREKEALKFINQKIDQYKAYELSSLTHNPIFDYQILGYINELRQMGYDIKPIITCQNNHSLERMEIIDFMKEAIDVFVEYTQDSKRFEIYLYEKNSVLILKMSADKQDVNLKKINTENLDYISQMEVIENSIGETELRVIFK